MKEKDSRFIKRLQQTYRRKLSQTKERHPCRYKKHIEYRIDNTKKENPLWSTIGKTINIQKKERVLKAAREKHKQRTKENLAE